MDFGCILVKNLISQQMQEFCGYDLQFFRDYAFSDDLHLLAGSKRARSRNTSESEKQELLIIDLSRPDDGARVLMTGERAMDSFSFSLDKKRLCFEQLGTIVVIDLESNRQSIAANGGFPSLSPQSDRISYVDTNGELVVRNLSGGGQTIRLGRVSTGGGSWSPDGSYIVFSRQLRFYQFWAFLDNAEITVCEVDSGRCWGLGTVLNKGFSFDWLVETTRQSH